MNALLDDFLAEEHNHLLEKGNLAKPHRNLWRQEFAWKIKGYSARIEHRTCRLCGTITPLLLGLFRDEETPSGFLRSLAVLEADYPLIPDQSWPVILTQSTTAVCPSCVFCMGFGEEKCTLSRTPA